MAAQELDQSPASKRLKLDLTPRSHAGTSTTITTSQPVELEKTVSKSLTRPISPPLSRRKRSATPTLLKSRAENTGIPTARAAKLQSLQPTPQSRNFLPSPIQLTRIKDLAPTQNVDTVDLNDILGDPMIKECWNFNFLFDLDFVMKHFDPDVREIVKVKIVHGFWRREDERRLGLQETAERYPNIELISAYMPDPFGTHHSKMLILFRHDDLAQIIIHTANMISRDWCNMTQAVWSSPLLPLQPSETGDYPGRQDEKEAHPIGSGARFRIDILRYLRAYGKRLGDLLNEILKYDFSFIHAAFIGSTPSRQKPSAARPDIQTAWGWTGLGELLSSIPVPPLEDRKSPPHVIIQVSSIATLGQTPTWLQNFQSILSRTASLLPDNSTSPNTASPSKPKPSNFFTKRNPKPFLKSKSLDPKFSIIFPTASEIRTSLDGYGSGFSIHTKLQSAAQQKQLQYLHPLLCHWETTGRSPEQEKRSAERGSAAPHIKTYIRFSDSEQRRIDWALVTSANLSKQAWGEMENKNGEVWIQSWECGVVVWPDLFKVSDEEVVEMVPVFRRDLPGEGELNGGEIGEEVEEGRGRELRKTFIGLRMPYDLPLEQYEKDEVPWCASLNNEEPDWKGAIWKGY
ncbi:phospholipase D/nuclease [Lindgomyces ingoldianus]|uniref:Phospholipase D/nuclease n=1 Tax=Lindgomyces ingoldianus TaxID=673940 RepID=A0ACB6RA78_9PLEO|nr:phospholipase D/nuclease [Lindgomyces ingoldianus]KAF2475673.1 phospholipase D/nuclease [Lindgomyces ingoldianus]